MAKRRQSPDETGANESENGGENVEENRPGTVDYREASVFLGVSVPQLFRYVDSHKLTPCFKKPGKPSRFWLTDLEELKERREEEKDGPEEKLSTLVPVAQLVKVMTDLIKQAESHAEKMVALITGPSKELHEQQSTHLATLGEELDRAHKKYHEILETSEKALTKAHDRQLETLREMASERRKDAMMGEIMKFAPTIASGVMGHLSGDKAGALGPLLMQVATHLSDEGKTRLVQAMAGESPEAQMALMRVLSVLEKAKKERGGEKQNGSPPVEAAPSSEPKKPPSEDEEWAEVAKAIDGLTDEDLERLGPRGEFFRRVKKDLASEKPS
jgi:hypothetical protein